MCISTEIALLRYASPQIRSLSSAPSVAGTTDSSVSIEALRLSKV